MMTPPLSKNVGSLVPPEQVLDMIRANVKTSRPDVVVEIIEYGNHRFKQTGDDLLKMVGRSAVCTENSAVAAIMLSVMTTLMFRMFHDLSLRGRQALVASIAQALKVKIEIKP